MRLSTEGPAGRERREMCYYKLSKLCYRFLHFYNYIGLWTVCFMANIGIIIFKESVCVCVCAQNHVYLMQH